MEFLFVMEKIKNNPMNVENLKGAFQVFDKDGNGFISADELREIMTCLGEKLTDKEAGAMIQEADINGDGMVDYDGMTKQCRI
jgi:calmodulin